MDYLAPLTALTALALPACLSLTGRLTVISALRALPRLRELDLSGCVFLGNIGVARLAGACAPFPNPNFTTRYSPELNLNLNSASRSSHARVCPSSVPLLSGIEFCLPFYVP